MRVGQRLLRIIDCMENDTSKRHYPPAQQGLRGSHPGSFDTAHLLRDGTRWSDGRDTGEFYDLIVVGGGLSGLASAWFYHQKRPKARILILENHDDFGGHARRNEFHIGDRMLLTNGGTINIENYNAYGEGARYLFESIGVDPTRYEEFHDDDVYRGLEAGMFFNKERYGEDLLVKGAGRRPWAEFFADAPLSDQARDDLARLFDSTEDYLAALNVEEKSHRLRQMSYEEFLRDIVGICDEAISVLEQDSYWAIGNDCLSAWAATADGSPGTRGLGLRKPRKDSVYFQFPDGNASIARMLVRDLNPIVAVGNTMEDIVSAQFNYEKLDDPDAQVRIRLSSTVTNVRHEGDPESAETVSVSYIHGGERFRVRASNVVLACYHSIIPHICSDLPEWQSKALALSLKGTLIYANVAVRNWQPFKNLGVNRIDCPGSYFSALRLQNPISMGDYQHARSPAEPNVINLFHTPRGPGNTPQEQWKNGRETMLDASLEDYEREIRQQLARILGPAGFDVEKDILGITVNRWAHGYAYSQNPETGEIAYLLDEVSEDYAPWIAGRQAHGRMVFANSDAAAIAMTEEAIGEAHRAVSELVP